MNMRTVLLVDDDPGVSEIIAELLEQAGYNTITASTGEKALSIIKEFTPSATIIDLKLPDMNGLDLIRKIRKLSSETEFIVVTGHASKESAIEAVNLGAYSYIQKPYDADNLLLALQRAIEKREAEATIRKQRDFVQRVLESITHPLCVIDVSNYRIVMANRAALETGGEDSSTCYSFYHRLNSPCSGDIHCPIEELKRTKREVTVDHVHRDRDGNERNIEIRGYPVLDEAGEVVQMITYAVDVTGRKVADESLRKSEEKYRSIFETSPEIIALFDTKGTVIDINDRVNDILGYERNEMIGKNVLTLPILTMKSRMKALKTLLQRLQGSEIPPYELEFRTRDGEARIGLVHGKILLDEDCNTIGDLVMVTDITKQKRINEALKQSENKFRAIFDQTVQYIGVCSIDGIIIDANKSALDLVGRTIEEVRGLPFWETPWWTHDSAQQTRLREAIRKAASGESLRFETTHLGTDGNVHTVDFSISPIVDDNGEILYLLPLGHDITNMKEAERELTSRMTELEEFNRTAVDRELKMIELKKEINDLLSEHGSKKKYTDI